MYAPACRRAPPPASHTQCLLMSMPHHPCAARPPRAYTQCLPAPFPNCFSPRAPPTAACPPHKQCLATATPSNMCVPPRPARANPLAPIFFSSSTAAFWPYMQALWIGCIPVNCVLCGNKMSNHATKSVQWRLGRKTGALVQNLVLDFLRAAEGCMAVQPIPWHARNGSSPRDNLCFLCFLGKPLLGRN